MVVEDIVEDNISGDEGFKKLHSIINPINLIRVLPRGLVLGFKLMPKLIWKGLCAIGRFGLIMGQFFKKLLQIIHSEQRLLCLIDGAIGSAVGYWAFALNGYFPFNGVIIGAVVGGVFAVLHKKLTPTIFKVVPRNGEVE